MYISVKELPSQLRNALESINYNKPDISIEGKEKVSLLNCGWKGRRGFARLVNLSTGESTRINGSWGGANAFDNSQVDIDDRLHTIPENGAVILGSEGNGGVWASIYLNPKNIIAALPTNEVLSEDKKYILHKFKSLKPAYRKLEGKESLVNELVSEGYLSRKSNGATQITTKGKNAIEGYKAIV